MKFRVRDTNKQQGDTMGYSGLKSWDDGDEAAGVVYTHVDKLVPVLKAGLRVSGNGCNPSGAVNVALFNEAFILPVVKHYASADSTEGKLLDVLELADKKLTKEIEWTQKSEAFDWRDGRHGSGSANKRFHLNAYLRMRKNLRKTLGVLRRESWR